MLKKIFNQISFDIDIDTVDPIIIKSGKASLSGPDDNPVKTWRSGKEIDEPFIPGSSLKGVFRSHLEKVVRTFNEELVCLPYLNIKGARENKIKGYHIFCGEKFRYRRDVDKEWSKYDPTPTKLLYSDSCPICKLFGSTFFKGRIEIPDAYLKAGTEAILEERDGVAIDRFTGGAASGALFQVEVVSKAQFQTRIVVHNFECWQIGMLAILMNDLADELIQIGSGTSRGFGRIRGIINNTTIKIFRALPNNSQIWGIGCCLGDGSYGTATDDSLVLSTPPTETIESIWKKYKFTGDALEELKTKSIEYFYQKLSTKWQLPESMRFDHIQRRN